MLNSDAVTPFDVVKTRLQTQPAQSAPLFPKPPRNVCCQPGPSTCVRNMSSMARSLEGDIVCVWENGMMRTERVNGFADAVKHVVRAEGIRGLWKGTGTTL
jgi:solute carrier family 25 protein 39/40